MKERIINEIIRIEGGYVNDPSDSGGETNFGITEAVARAYRYTGAMRDMPRGPGGDRMTISTKNFHPDTDRKLLCTCGHPACDQRSVNQETLNKAQVGREILGHPLTVTSGGRCPNHPDELHRTTPADHQKQQGIDVAVNGATRGNVVAAGLAAGFNAIGVAKTFVHWGYRPELPKGHVTMWVYS